MAVESNDWVVISTVQGQFEEGQLRAFLDAHDISLLIPTARGQLVDAADRAGFWHQDSTDILGTNEADDIFGFASVSGDFNNDGFPDLAVGAPGEAIGDLVTAGSVHVIYGGDHDCQRGLQAHKHPPCPDEPDDRARWRIGIADHGLRLVSNTG